MPTHVNACGELTRLWLETQFGYLVREGVPVPVPYALSDIDIVALHPTGSNLTLRGRIKLGPRLIVETKDEHDWEPTGREFGKLLRTNLAQLAGFRAIPRGAKGVKFSMLRQEQFDVAATVFNTTDVDRLFVVHASDESVLAEHADLLRASRVHWISVRDVVDDLVGWYRTHPRPAAMRMTLTGDLLHLLVGFCGFKPQSTP